jgi:hypothetical protein
MEILNRTIRIACHTKCRLRVERRLPQQAATHQLPLCPVGDRNAAAMQHVAEGQFRKSGADQ